MRRIRLTQDVPAGFGDKRKKGDRGTVVKDIGHRMLQICWDDGSMTLTFIAKRYVEDATVLDDLVKALS